MVPTLALAALLAQADLGAPRLIAAGDGFETAAWSARRWFNAGLVAEEAKDLPAACAAFLAALSTQGDGVADEVYSRGAGLRLVRVLAGRDDDAATAAALLVAPARFSELGPLIRMLRRRVETGDGGLEEASGLLASVRVDRGSGRVALELETEAGSRIVLAPGSVAPFSAGDRVRALLKRTRGSATAGWEIIALGYANASGWRLLRVAGLDAASSSGWLGGPLEIPVEVRPVGTERRL